MNIPEILKMPYGIWQDIFEWLGKKTTRYFTKPKYTFRVPSWKGISIDNNFTKIKVKKNNNHSIFLFYLGLLKRELPKKHIFQIW
jgi:hypothetical protein